MSGLLSGVIIPGPYSDQRETLESLRLNFASLLSIERVGLAEVLLLAICYGFEVFLFGICIRGLWQNASVPRARSIYVLLASLTAILIANTVWFISMVYSFHVVIVEYYVCLFSFLGPITTGTPACLNPNPRTIAMQYIGSGSYAIGNMLADGLLLWRAHAIWRPVLSPKAKWIFISLPCCLIVISVGLNSIGISLTALTSNNNAYLLSSTSASLFTNIVMASLIAIRLWLYRKQIQAAFGKSYGKPYKLISLIIVESASIYVLFSILLLSAAISGNNSLQIWLSLNPPVQNIANMLILYRLSNGKAWKEEYSTMSIDATGALAGEEAPRESAQRSTLLFARPPTSIVSAHSQTHHTVSLAFSIPGEVELGEGVIEKANKHANEA
ncbi:hypothetical protein K474DRAFT_1670583 [Panus rudis PR-1116 ss-1]|nr:hypothetical protein K474DRAFT_1670583 [Panus rudis PR-1116 ss-1]